MAGRRTRSTPTQADAIATAGPGEARPPRQERGQRRVDAVLDATAAIIAEEGVAGATMHAIAKRSSTTIGSMYHFFPDREAVLVALVDRHMRGIGAMVAELDAVDWAALTLGQAVDRFVDTCVGYVFAHPDLLPLAHAMDVMRPELRSDRAPDGLLIGVAQSIVAARAPGLPAAERTARASMMVAALEGTVERAHRNARPSLSVLQRELKRMFVAYLGTFG